MLFYGYFTNEYRVDSIKVCEEIHHNSDNSDVIVLLKTEHTYLFKRTTQWNQKKQNRTVSYYWNIKFTPRSKLPQRFQWLESQPL